MRQTPPRTVRTPVARLRASCWALLGLAAAAVMVLLPASASAETCKPEDIPAAVDETGATLRKFTLSMQPELQPRLKALAAKYGWGEEGYEEQAFAHLKDDKVAKLDQTANELLARIDMLGEFKPGEAPDCARVDGIRAAGIELLAVMKAKTALFEAKLDTELGKAPAKAQTAAVQAGGPAPLTRDTASTAPSAVAPSSPDGAKPRTEGPRPPSADSAPPARKPGATDAWSAKTNAPAPRPPAATLPAAGPAPDAPATATGTSTPAQIPPISTETRETTIAMLPPLPPVAGDGPRPSEGLREPPTLSGEDGYSIDEIRAATRGFFGGVSTGLASVIEHAFRKSGRPTGYVLGVEGGGAFIGGLRYGKGTLYLRNGGTEQVYWHGPSLGFDFGASGTRTMFLAYKLREIDDIYRTFTGIDGSAFVVGGVGITLLAGGNAVLAPIRSGLGVRLGASIGYIRFTPTQTWNPF